MVQVNLPTLTITITQEDLNLIVNVVGTQPYNQVAPFLSKLAAQVQAQLPDMVLKRAEEMAEQVKPKPAPLDVSARDVQNGAGPST